MDKLTKEDIAFIIESLNYTKLKFEEYDKYPSYEFKLKRIEKVQKLLDKMRKIETE